MWFGCRLCGLTCFAVGCVLCEQKMSNVSDLGLTFAVDHVTFGKHSVVELMPGGTNIAVDEHNKLLFLHLLADYVCVVGCSLTSLVPLL
jgi:hypothetical protein